MLRFLHVLYLNAWRGMRRANGTPAIVITLIAASVLFVGSNASARASIQTAMHVVGLPGALSPVVADSPSGAKSINGGTSHNSNTGQTNQTQNNSSDTSAPKDTSSSTQNATVSNHQKISATVNLIPSTVTPVCSQGVSQYVVQTAAMTLAQPTSNASNFIWNIETRIDNGSNSGAVPISNALHTQFIDAGVQTEQINPSDPTQPLVSANANPNYSYSFRLDISGPFIGTSDWVSVPASSGCPQ